MTDRWGIWRHPLSTLLLPGSLLRERRLLSPRPLLCTSRVAASPGLLRGHVGQRIDDPPVDVHLVMEVRAGREAAVADRGDGWPRVTRWPARTTTRERWAYLVSIPLPCSISSTRP